MLDDRSLKLDLAALILLALIIFLAVALFTYNPADPLPALIAPLNLLYRSDALVYPPGEVTTNLCGIWGALASDFLLNGLGLGSYYLVLSLGILDILLLMRRPISTPMLRAFGWVASLIGLTAIVTLAVPGLSPGPVIGSGGYLGAVSRGILEAHFATAGSLILATSVAVAGLLLCTEYSLLRVTGNVLGCTTNRMQKAFTHLATRRTESESDVEQDEETWEDEEEEAKREKNVSILIRGKKVAELVEEKEEEEIEDEDEVEEEYEDEDEDEVEDEEEEEDEEPEAIPVLPKRKTAPANIRTRVASALGLHKQRETSREEVMEELEAASQSDEHANYELPQLDLLLKSDDFSFDEQEKEVRRKAKVLEKTFANFGFVVKVVEVETGPVIAQYEVELEAGLRLSRITGLADDLAIALRVPSVRIVAPIPGKNTVGIEVPNQERQLVRLREVMEELDAKTKKMRIPLFLGKDVSGNPLAVDLSSLPHLLIAGRTGTGKSVCLNAIISSILMTRRPDEVRMLMIDPKMVELSGYKTLPHLMHPVVTDMRKAEAILAWAVEKMEERYELLARAGVRHVGIYNQLGEDELMDRLEPETDEERAAIPMHLPYIVIVADEMADLMMTSGKEVEQHIIRLAQKSRAVGIHLILATQKPTVDVITGLIKSNLPARIAFQVASRTDSRVVLDEMGAEKLLGDGDMLFLWPGTSALLRGQGIYLSDDEIDRIVNFVSTGEQHFVKELIHMKVDQPGEPQADALKRRDDLYEAAVDIVVNERRGSVSLLQRALGIGYGRAARLIDFMAEDGIVGTYAGSQAREVLISPEDWASMQNGGSEDPVESPKPMRSSHIVALSANRDQQPDDGPESAVTMSLLSSRDADDPEHDTTLHDDADAWEEEASGEQDDEEHDERVNDEVDEDEEDDLEEDEEEAEDEDVDDDEAMEDEDYEYEEEYEEEDYEDEEEDDSEDAYDEDSYQAESA